MDRNCGEQLLAVVDGGVALLAEGVDRNFETLRGEGLGDIVALLAEGVDRNLCALDQLADQRVALLAEGVDRNFFIPKQLLEAEASPSSRRAWIEIVLGVIGVTIY